MRTPQGGRRRWEGPVPVLWFTHSCVAEADPVASLRLCVRSRPCLPRVAKTKWDTRGHPPPASAPSPLPRLRVKGKCCGTGRCSPCPVQTAGV